MILHKTIPHKKSSKHRLKTRDASIVLIGTYTYNLSGQGHTPPDSVDSRDRVPGLDHVFVIVLENHNSFTSFGSAGILDHPQALHLRALAKPNNVATNYNRVWHPSLPNYVAMITGDWIGTDLIGTGRMYPREAWWASVTMILHR